MSVATLHPPRSTTPREGLWTLEESATYLQIAPGTLKHWVALKLIEHVKVGKYTRFTKSALDRYIQRQTVAARDDDEDR